MTPVKLPDSNDRSGAIEFVKTHAPWAVGAPSPLRGGASEAKARLESINAASYSKTRNHLDGAVSGLSPYIRHGVIGANDVRNHILNQFTKNSCERFLQQLSWRDYWHRLYRQNPDWIWNDIEPYKTGFQPQDYAQALPSDITQGETGVAAIDQFIQQLTETGWVHNHARLYLAAYICHWRRVKWQAGARWMMMHLLDGDPASNNLSWQWVASTFAHKPYFFNLDNIRKYCGADIDTSCANNTALSGSYEDIYNRLFPNLEPRA